MNIQELVLKCLSENNCSILVLRRNYSSTMLASMSYLNEAISANKKVFFINSHMKLCFPNGSIIYFGWIEKDEDKYRYLSARFDYIDFGSIDDAIMQELSAHCLRPKNDT